VLFYQDRSKILEAPFAPFDCKAKNSFLLHTVVPQVISIKINGNAVYLSREPFGFALTAVDAACCDVDRPENLVASDCGCVLVGGRVCGRGRKRGRGGVLSQ
jgi:hypothetical protein